MSQYIAADQLSAGDRISVHGDAPTTVVTTSELHEPGFVYVVAALDPIVSASCNDGRVQYRLGHREHVALVRRHCAQHCGRTATCYAGGPAAGDWADYVCEECRVQLGWQVFDNL